MTRLDYLKTPQDNKLLIQALSNEYRQDRRRKINRIKKEVYNLLALFIGMILFLSITALLYN